MAAAVEQSTTDTKIDRLIAVVTAQQGESHAMSAQTKSMAKQFDEMDTLQPKTDSHAGPPGHIMRAQLGCSGGSA